MPLLLLVRTLPDTSFAMKRTAKLTHHASYQYNINKTMCYKIKLFCNKLKPDSGIKWEIAHLIHQTLLQQQLEIVCWKVLEDFPSPWDSGGTFVFRMK
jgi:hypothetical protein